MAEQICSPNIILRNLPLIVPIEHVHDAQPLQLVGTHLSDRHIYYLAPKVSSDAAENVDVAGCIVTIDAMGCQKDIAQAIVNGQADYVLALKENHPVHTRK